MSTYATVSPTVDPERVRELLKQLVLAYQEIVKKLQALQMPPGLYPRGTCPAGSQTEINIRGNILWPRPLPRLIPPPSTGEEEKEQEKQRKKTRTGKSCSTGAGTGREIRVEEGETVTEVTSEGTGTGGGARAEILKSLEQALQEKLGRTFQDIIPRELAERLEKTSTVLQEGEEQELGSRDWWRRRVVEIVRTAKAIGTAPGEFFRWLEKLLKPAVEWRELLRSIVGMAARRYRTDETWLRPHRRVPEMLPGRIKHPAPNIWCLVDTSGSISDEELAQFASEIFSIMRMYRTPVNVIFWDAAAYGPYEVPFTMEPEKFIEMYRQFVRGGGGTLIGPALAKLLKNMKKRDIVVIFTDAEIGDLDNPDVKAALDLISKLAGAAVFVTTYRTYTPPGAWAVIKIHGKEARV